MENETHGVVRTEIDDRGDLGKVATVELDYAPKLNIVGSQTIRQLTAAFQRLHPLGDLRVVILRGAGEKAFIGGADIREMAELKTREEAESFISRLHGVCAAIRTLPVPVIAQIRGHCLGAGLEIAASCDLRIASEDAQFGMPEVKVGIPSVIEAALLPRLMGWGKARELVFTGESIPAAEALLFGLVEKIVPAEELGNATEAWVNSILGCGPRAIRLQKALIRKWEELPLEKAIEEGIRYFGESFETEEPNRMMNAFIERKAAAKARRA